MTRRIVIVDDDGRPLKAPPARRAAERAAEDDWLDHIGEAHPEAWDITLPAPSGQEAPCPECHRLQRLVDQAATLTA